MEKSLIVYYSRAGENYFSGTLRTVETGNTELAARTLSELTGAGLFRLEQLTPYSKQYNACIQEAQADQRRDARPELRACPDTIAPYDVIYLGYPNYWGTMPMAVWTFLEKFDFTGKIIRPFCTHEGSGLGRSEADIRRLCAAKVEKGLAIPGGSAGEAKGMLKKWIGV